MQEYKAQLLKLKSEYEQRIQRTEKHLTHEAGPVSQDFAEQAVERENEEVIERLDEEAKHELALVKLALSKLEAGIYGECESCGEDIAKARLSAVPQAKKCINCEQ